MSLDARVMCSIGAVDLDVTLTANAGEVVAIFGPNGAGKSTLLRCLAGLLPLDDGYIRLDGRVLDEPTTGTFVVPEDRAVGMVFQDYLLFPTMSALENVAFGLRAHGTKAADARREAAHWIERVGLSDQGSQLPTTLSGGQAQRVALARALAPRPQLLLLDEPLAALDAGTKTQLRRELRQHLLAVQGVRLLVTHDPVDAYALADRVIVMESGHVTHVGTLTDVSAQPRSRYVADLVGVNLLSGVARDGTVVTDSGATIQTGTDLTGPAFVLIQPRSLALYRTRPEGSPRNVWPLIVTDIDVHAGRVRLHGELALVAEVTLGALGDLGLAPGDTVWATVKATEVTSYPA